MNESLTTWFRATRDVISVTGADSVTFLQGQISADLVGLGVADSTTSLILSPAGKIDAWCRVTRTAADAVTIDVDAGLGELITARLSRFKIRVDVDMTWQRMDWLAVRGDRFVAERPGGVVIWGDTFWPGVIGTDVIGEPNVIDGLVARHLDAGAQLSIEQFDALRIAAGVPVVGVDVDGDTIPGEAGTWLVEASVSFTKGCYVGQELVARVDSRGNNTPRRLRALVASAATMEVGDQLTDPVAADKLVGTVTSVAWSDALAAQIGLALIHRTVDETATLSVVRGARPTGLTAAVRDVPLD